MAIAPVAAPVERKLSASPRAIAAATEILTRWLEQDDRGGLDRLVQGETRRRRELNSSERRWLVEAIFGIVRRLRRLTWVLHDRGSEANADELVAIWAESGAAAAAPNLPGPDVPADYLRIALSYSDEMAAALESLLGEEAVAAGVALNGPAPATLRVNVLRASRTRVLHTLSGTRRTRFSPWGVELEGRSNVHELEGFRDGWYEAQEEASQIVALLTDAQPGQTVVDIGAGAGGKSLAIAAMIGSEGSVIALDTSRERLARLEERATRAHAKAIRPLRIDADETGRWQLSATKRRTLNRLERAAECVLVDAPCSGSGVIRRSPDLKWRGGDIAEHARAQSVLLQQSAPLVAPHGVLIYATCAIEREQNEDVVEQFLASEAGEAFEITPALPRLMRAMGRVGQARDPGTITPSAGELESLMSGPFLRTWPHRHGMDAFFAACLVRRA